LTVALELFVDLGALELLQIRVGTKASAVYDNGAKAKHRQLTTPHRALAFLNNNIHEHAPTLASPTHFSHPHKKGVCRALLPVLPQAASLGGGGETAHVR
jgi:hypothetical protein